TLNSPKKIDKIIITELTNIKKKYGTERKTEILYDVQETEIKIEETIEDYQCNFFFTKEGYFKKITPLSLRMGGAHKLKENDEISQHIEATNTAQLLFFSDKCQVYKSKSNDFNDTKASVMGDYIPTALEFEKDENAIYMVSTYDYKGYMLFFFENGKAAKIPLKSYETKANRKKLLNAYSGKNKLISMLYIPEDCDIVMTSTNGKILIINTGLISPKTAKDSQGVNVMTQKGKNTLHNVELLKDGMFENPGHYKTANIPSVGKFKRKTDDEKEQLSLI
ncbi:MAG: topoisomerase IV, partial [Clostridia bacterium]|nr:topoisomerase IV [Clostridia bacterium]